MRYACLPLLALLLHLTSHSLAAEPTDLDQLQGDWRKVQFENNGTPGEADAMPTVRIREDKVRLLQEGKEQESIELKLKLEPATDPKLLDIVLPDGQTLEGIYKLEAGRWTICVNSEPGVKSRPATFESKQGSKLILAVFEKAQ